MRLNSNLKRNLVALTMLALITMPVSGFGTILLDQLKFT